jgi:site-specific DNA recombinase
VAESQAQQRMLVRQLARDNAALATATSPERIAELQERIAEAERRLRDVQQRLAAAGTATIDEHEVRTALSSFTPLWEAMTPREQARVVRLLVERVAYDGDAGTVSLTFSPTGIRTLALEQRPQKEAA